MSPANDSATELATRAAAALRGVVPRRPDHSVQGRDSLTGLFDGRALHDALATAIADAEQRSNDVGLLFLDLDYFKRINDLHGHQAGSRILRQVAALLRTAADDAGGFAARYGGDEFVAVLPGAGLDRCLRVAERLRATLAAAIFAGGEPPGRRPLVHVTCSIGAASMRAEAGGGRDETPGPAGDATRLLQLADNAMYRAKKAGRNRVAAAGAEAGYSTPQGRTQNGSGAVWGNRVAAGRS